MSLWIRVEQSLQNHPKTLKLQTELKLDKDVVIGRLIRLWCWCLDYAFDGDLRKFDALMIESACGLPLSSLVLSGFVDYRPYRRIHGWWEYAGNYLKQKYKNQPEKWRQIEKSYDPILYGISKGTPKGTPKRVDVEDVDREEKKEDVQTYTTSKAFASRFPQKTVGHVKGCTCEVCFSKVARI
jgi:hypothetical protein